QPSGDSKLSVFDFPLFSTFRDNVTKGSLGGVKGILDYDWTYADPTQLVTFFQNHDVGPDNDFKYRYGGEPANAALAYNLLWTVRGIPSLYYGEEVMFQAGLPQDISGNSDTVDQTGRAYFGDKLANRATLQAHPLYQHIKRLNQIRKAVPALQKGTMLSVNEWGNGMSFVRDAGTSYAIVGLATGSSQSITVSGVKNGTYRDAVTGREVTVGNGSLTFTVNPYSIGAYVLNGPGKVGADGNWLK
ncbi:MAG: alpha-amylase, partial [Aeromonadaceae bacterium]|nr:alpha-amylase [Aeromonadaceae bacterium]